MNLEWEVVFATQRSPSGHTLIAHIPGYVLDKKLLRQYPKAKAECIKEYYSCPAYLGYSCPSPKVSCKECWDVPIEE